MRCTEWTGRLGFASLTFLAGCSGAPESPPVASTTQGAVARSSPSAPREPVKGSAAAQAAAGPAAVRLSEPRNSRNWAEVRVQAAERMVAANREGTYMGTVPEALLAIPVLEIELNGDGSVRRIEVLRSPRQAKDTIEIAANAVRRAAPFGNVSRLPKPWKFVETFLFDDDRRFKPRTLDR